MFMKILVKMKKIFDDFSNYSLKSKYYGDSNKLVVGKMEDEMGGMLLNNLLGWKQRCIHS